VRRTWGAQQLDLVDQADAITGSIESLGRQSLESLEGPSWAAEAARRSGVPIPLAARLSTFTLGALDETSPESVEDWLDLLVEGIGELPPEELRLLLDVKAFASTALSGLFSEEVEERDSGREALSQTLRRWIEGAPLSEVGGAAHGTEPIESPDRGEGRPIPRTIRLINDGIGFGLTRAAGLLAAILDVAIEEEAVEAPSEASRQSLQRLPVVLRLGASDPQALALLRAGARPRAIAHLLADILEPPENLPDNDLQEWARAQLRGLEETLERPDIEQETKRVLAQFLLAREAR
jgi:hypothetical protein